MQRVFDRRAFVKLAAQSTALSASVAVAQAPSNAAWRQKGNLTQVLFGDNALQLQPYLDGVLRVRYGALRNLELMNKSLAVQRGPQAGLNVSCMETSGRLEVLAAGVNASIDLKSGSIQFSNAVGKPLLLDLGSNPGSATPNGPKICRSFQLTAEEAIYGLGQYRNGIMNWRRHALDMVQFNTQAAIPVLLSTHGYGLFWNNPSRTLFEDFGDQTTFRSEEGPYVEYFIVEGPRFDDILRRYRQLTGPSPIIPRWALGYVQSRNRYQSQDELLDVVRKQRALKLPLDAIFLDYYYWGKQGFGSDVFEKSEFPDPKAMVEELHQLNTRLIVSIWPSFSPGCENFETMNKAGFLLEGTTLLDGAKVYDAFNPEARKLYWELLTKSLLPVGIDGWFLDSSEPDAKGFQDATTAIGPARDVLNEYSLAHTTSVYEGLRERDPDQRIFIITRCAFAGQQRNAAADWSGDIDATFLELSVQIPAGLNFCMTGIPYWTTDIGGYHGGDPNNIFYRELFIRWWQYGTFCPLFRAHGRREPMETRRAPNELWAYGEEVQTIAAKFARLRYRLMPYLYSLAAKVASDGYTIMRALAFDFPEDKAVYEIADQFMFGPSLLVCPVIQSGSRKRSVHLPKSCDWIDFWTGQKHLGGRSYGADAPLEKIPLLVRAGSILPLAPPAEHTGELADPIEIRIYPGADGNFTIYEDDGTTFACDRGESSTIELRWEDQRRRLVIGTRHGQFPAMLQSRTFQIIVVDQTNGLGESTSPNGTTVGYSGKELTLHLP